MGQSVKTCCICSGNEEVVYCSKCDHFFCLPCRYSLYRRGYEALKQWLTERPPKNCHCKEIQ
jgi:hypothetical protein